MRAPIILPIYTVHLRSFIFKSWSGIKGVAAAVRNGDTITLDVERNLIQLNVSDEEIVERLKDVKLKEHPDIKRGFVRNFIDNVLQADEGCDLKYL